MEGAAGLTLVELIIVIAILGVLVGVAGVTFTSLRPPTEARVLSVLRAARSEAIRSGRPTVSHVGELTVRFLPDGSSSGGRVELDGHTFVIDPLSGEIRAVE